MLFLYIKTKSNGRFCNICDEKLCWYILAAPRILRLALAPTDKYFDRCIQYKVRSFPIAVLRWYKDGKELQPTASIVYPQPKAEGNVMTGCLLFKINVPLNNGIYTLKATNWLGSHTMNTTAVFQNIIGLYQNILH